MTLLSDTRFIFIRYMTKLVRTLSYYSFPFPTNFIPRAIHQLLGKLSNFPGVLPAGVAYLEFAAAGIVMQNAFGSALQSGNSIVADIDSGYLQKMLVTPVSRPAILLGRLASDAFRVVVQTAIILGLGYALGVAEKQAILHHHWCGWNFADLFHACLLWSCMSGFLCVRYEDTGVLRGFAIASHHLPLCSLSPALFPLSFLPGWVQTSRC